MDTPASTRQSEAAHGLDLDDQTLMQHWSVLRSGFRRLTSLLMADVEAKVGISPSALEVLCVLLETPEHAVPMGRLTQALGFSTAGTTKVADRLMDAGLIERRACPQDRRLIYAALTERGLEVATDCVAVLVESLRRRVVEPLGAERFRSISADIGSIEPGTI
ncbi:MarR family transcriptional regulator [Planotetraspora thailandica]|uniref:MarR family transcriptional regulator n=1 Tax=Planotetraspora thailandica TaxID=487172 RepID=A0A8J4DEA2_9ACTN|nr:MarR family transcriptional regulator [Planotetraspora thailandica]GII58262.1 MarR family transcriptional regulator [Planotetraspora thailandica]